MALIDRRPRPRETPSATAEARPLHPSRRAASRFPAAVPSSVPVRWLGGADVLLDAATDHVHALGADLVPAEVDDERGGVALVDVRALDRRRPRLERGRHTLLVALTAAPPTEAEWRTCVDVGAGALLRLPEDSARLLDLLAPALRAARPSLVLGVVGGCGGAGASSTAARLAAAAAAVGEDVVLVDGDPLGGGIDALVEAPGGRGACWEDLGALGPDDGSALREGLPLVDGVRILASSADGPPSPDVTASALDALAPVGGVVIADLGAETVPAVLPLLDLLVVVLPARPHAVRAGALRLRRWGVPPSVGGVIVRRRGPLAPEDVAAELGIELLGSFRDGPAGLVPLLDVRRRGADRACARVLYHLLAARRAGGPS